MTITTRNVQETLALGCLIGRLAPPGTCIALNGQLGSGKTHLTRGIAEGAQVEDAELVSSPTYVLLNIYPGKKPVYHLDAYRMGSAEDFAAVGFEELVKGGSEKGEGLVVVEWAQKVAELLPEDCLRVEIEMEDEGGDAEAGGRVFEVRGTGVESKGLEAAIVAGW